MLCTITLFNHYYIRNEIIMNCIQVTVSVVVWLRVGDWWHLLAHSTTLQVGCTLLVIIILVKTFIANKSPRSRARKRTEKKNHNQKQGRERVITRKVRIFENICLEICTE